MGAVFEAVHEAIERRVAIKVLHPEYAKKPEFIARFFNEARAVNRVSHPGLVQVSDYGQLDDGTAYIVMEYLKGDSLRRRLERCGGSPAVADALRLGIQIAAALTAAHEKGIIHRGCKRDEGRKSSQGGACVRLADSGARRSQSLATRASMRRSVGSDVATCRCRRSGVRTSRCGLYGRSPRELALVS